jgi:hypothetical protein
MAGFCIHGNVPFGSVEGVEFIYQLSYCHLLNEVVFYLYISLKYLFCE